MLSQKSDNKNTKVLLGMSGGVDSSVSALLLKQAGYQITGCFMKNWEEDDTNTYCAAAQDLADAQAVADQLDIPFLTINFSTEYWDHVFEYFLEEYKAYRTPNPDILCNKEIKFNYFLKFAQDLDFDLIATGHYARKDLLDLKIINQNPGYVLKKGTDPNKDQSYFLYAISQFSLAKALFPIGNLTKPEVRKIAEKAKLKTFQKRDSTGICFIGEKRFKQFLSQYLPHQPGDIITPEGLVIGKHDGLMYYTFGQRSGLNIGGVKNAKEAPWYVAEKKINTNQLVCVQDHDHELLLKKELFAEQLTWLNPAALPSETNFKAHAKTRYRQADQPCEVIFQNDKKRIKVVFETNQRAITPGQSIVIYTKDTCLGGGVII